MCCSKIILVFNSLAIFHHSVEGWCGFFCCLEMAGDSWGVAAAGAGAVTPAHYLTPCACLNKVSGATV